MVLALLGGLAARAVALERAGSGPNTPYYPGYWHTAGTSIVDRNNQPVRIASVTWYGMESSYWVPAGLDYQPYTAIMQLIKHLGYNTVRLPFSNELVESNPTVTEKIAANLQFKGRHALDVLDSIVRFAGHIGLKIILDDHRCEAARPKRVNFLDEPLWYTANYPESSWIADWRFLARRYLNNSTVIGFDLRNEPHTDGPGPWNLHAYLTQGATWGPYGGVESLASDWRLAAERAGNAVLAVNPHLLMFVEGLQLYPDSQQSDGIETYWWGSILTPARTYPVVFNTPHQLVYSPHDWGPWKWNMWWFRHMTYESIRKIWYRHWSFLIEDAGARYAAPVWIGEFGTCHTNPGCIDKEEQGNQAQWFHLFLRYLHDHPEVGWSFFALDGTNSNDHATSNGLLNARWDGVSDTRLQADLEGVQPR